MNSHCYLNVKWEKKTTWQRQLLIALQKSLSSVCSFLSMQCVPWHKKTWLISQMIAYGDYEGAGLLFSRNLVCSTFGIFSLFLLQVLNAPATLFNSPRLQNGLTTDCQQICCWQTSDKQLTNSFSFKIGKTVGRLFVFCWHVHQLSADCRQTVDRQLAGKFLWNFCGTVFLF